MGVPKHPLSDAYITPPFEVCTVDGDGVTNIFNHLPSSNPSKTHHFDEEPIESSNTAGNTASITDFYAGAGVFITGATGFVGKALLEKLLRTCVDIKIIYVLMRPKRGMTVEQRLKELTKNPVFGKLLAKDSDAFNKVQPICGDVSLPDLGLTALDKQRLIQHVSIVFHSAATVKFNEDLRNAVILNTLGTKRVLELCHEIKKLKSFVHVSTAYSNSDRTVIEETIYDPPCDPDTIIRCVEMLPRKCIEMLTQSLLGKHPNTYTFTKALAEHLVWESSALLPTAVVRPSIITAAWREPFPGWVDNVSGITGIFMECGRGTIKSIICDDRCTMDLIPVDVVVQTIVTAAWHTCAYRANLMRVYNCTSGCTAPITWRQFGQLTHKYSLQYPSQYVTWYPGFTYRTSRSMHLVCATLFQLLPAALLDVILLLFTKQKPIMLKISRKFFSALDAGKFFSTNEWDFRDETMRSLVEAVQQTEDGAMHFELVDLSERNGFEWDTYVRDFILGVRKYVLKDDMSTLPKAKTKLNSLYWLQKVVQAVSIYTVLRLAIR